MEYQAAVAAAASAPDEKNFADYILILPVSDIPPIYIYIRNNPGQVTGKGQKVTGTWLADAGQGNGSPIPSQIADKLRGRTFSSFDGFSEAFWQEVSKDPELSSQFDIRNLATMKNGRSAYARKFESVGQRVKYELHHIEEIRNGGAVYDVDNLSVTTPKRHIEIHQGNKMVAHKEIADFTEAEFLKFVEDICNDIYTSEKAHMAAVAEFERISGHPSGSDLIYYPEEGKGGPLAIVQEIKEWRKANGKPGFREE